MPRRFRSPDESESKHDDQLPVNRPVGLYYRQSTEGQIGNISTTIQTVDMHDRLQKMGWHEDNIILIDVDAGVSGRLKIDEREGMRHLFSLISKQKIGAVAAQDEDRFFRDETMIQVDIFIDACKQNKVKVITPNMVYDFAHPMMGTMYEDTFRLKSRMSAEFIKTQVIGKLGGARNFLMRIGRWAGSHIPVGYMVDAREELSPGKSNPDHRRFFPFEPFADVVKDYYTLFLATGGDLAKTHHRILDEHRGFPNPNTTKPPTGFKTHCNIKFRRDGYYISRPALRALLMNPIYIGHWLFKDVVVRWDNHEAIVPEDVFWQSFHYLSPYLLDGSPNPDYRPVKQHSRPSLEISREVERPLCSGLLYGLVEGTPKQITTAWDKPSKTYHYALISMDTLHSTPKSLWRRQAFMIDEAIVYHTMDRLRETFRDDDWEEMVKKRETEPVPDDKDNKRKQLQIVSQQKQNLLVSLETLTEPDMFQHAQTRYQELKIEEARLLSELQPKQVRRLSLEQLSELRDHFEELVTTGWAKMTRDKRHLFLQQMIERIVLVEYGNYGHSRLIITWRDPGETEVFVYRTVNRGNPFTYAEMEMTRKMLLKGASKTEIRQVLPGHPKGSVSHLVDRINRSFETSTETPCTVRVIRNHYNGHDIFAHR